MVKHWIANPEHTGSSPVLPSITVVGLPIVEGFFLRGNKMAARNDITGDNISSKTSNDKFRDGWELAFGKKKEALNNSEKETSETSESTDE